MSSVPYGSIPWTQDKNSKRVSFLTPHVITVVDGKGYHLYHIDPKYKFKELEICKKFQSTLRERELLDAFLAVKIKQAGTTMSQGQVIRFWRRTSSEKEKIVTMTFLESSTDDGPNHKELDIGQFRQDPKFVIPRTIVGIRRPEESDALDIFSVVPQKSLRIKFETIQGSYNSTPPID
jgi:hypothetical protein